MGGMDVMEADGLVDMRGGGGCAGTRAGYRAVWVVGGVAWRVLVGWRFG